MASLAIARWLVARTARMPLAWVVWALLGSVWPLGMARSPLGIGLSEAPPATLFYEVAFVSAVLGGALGLLSLGRARFLLAPLSRSERFLGEGLGLLLVVGMSLMAPLLTLPFVAPGLGPIQPTPVVGRLALMAAHVAALSLLISRAPTSTGLHLALLVALSWWIPAVLSTLEGSVGAISHLLDVSGRLARLDAPVEDPRAGLADLAPVGAAALAAWLLDPPLPSRS